MVKTKEGDGIKSSLIVNEVKKRPCLYDTNHQNYGDRTEKAKCWVEVYENVVPGWCGLLGVEKFAAGKEVQKRWRSIRDSYTKAFRQGKCLSELGGGGRRSQYYHQMSFLFNALQNKKPRYSQEKYDSHSEVSNSPQHTMDDMPLPRIKHEQSQDFKARAESESKTQDKGNQAVMNPSLEIKIDANSILPDDHFDDDKLFMNSLLPLFRKMDDDTRLLCRIEVLKTIRYLLQGNRMSLSTPTCEARLPNKREMCTPPPATRPARPQRKRKIRSPSPLPSMPKKRGPGRPRKVRPPPSDSDSEAGRRAPEPAPEPDDTLDRATSVAQLSTPLFMKMYNLERSKAVSPPHLQVTVKSEPADTHT